MNSRTLVLALLFAASSAFAQTPDAAAERAATLKSLQRGKAIQGANAQYRLLPEVQALEQGAARESPQQTVARVGEAGGQVLEAKGKLVLYKSSRVKPAYVEQRAGKRAFPTVINVRSGSLGVLTGNLIVKPKSLADADAIAGSYGLEKTKAYPQLKTVFYKAKPGADLADVSASLQADPRIEVAYPEIIEHIRVPK
jgi:hypothetical protein